MKNVIYLAAAMHIALCSVLLPFWMTLIITIGMAVARFKLIGHLLDNPKQEATAQ